MREKCWKEFSEKEREFTVGKIKELFGTQEKFADAMSMSTVTLSAKLNGRVDWTQAEMNLACDLLGVPYEFIPILFFTKKVKSS